MGGKGGTRVILPEQLRYKGWARTMSRGGKECRKEESGEFEKPTATICDIIIKY